MKIPTNLQCEICSKVFCCPQCRVKHEINSHMASGKVISCPICCGVSMYALQSKTKDHLFDHIIKEHLPMHCAKCLKTFKELADFENLKSCEKSNQMCSLNNHPLKELTENIDSERKNETTMNSTSNSSQNSAESPSYQLKMPQLQLAPQWSVQKEKLPERSASISDSVSSIRNYSSIDGSSHIMQKSMSPNRKLVQQTSTPMHRIVYKIKRSSFDSLTSSCQMSSIDQSNSDSDISPPIRSHSEHSPVHSIKSVKTRHKLPAAATPLRQVMSKSIQKAIIQHGLPISHKTSFSPASNFISMTPPLDLRTSPVIRRTKSESDQMSNVSQATNGTTMEDMSTKSSLNSVNIHISVQASSTHRSIHSTSHKTLHSSTSSVRSVHSAQRSIQSMCSQKSINSSELHLNTVYETCRIIEQNSELDEFQTPKTTGVLKKTTSFADRHLSKEEENEDDDVWYTPIAAPIRTASCPEIERNKSASMQLEHRESNPKEARKIKRPLEKERQDKNTGNKLWSYVSSLVRMATFNSREPEVKNEPQFESTTVKRCASFAGSTNRKENGNEWIEREPPNKRRRTLTVNMPLTNGDSTHIKQLKRIHGRMPIERMRKIKSHDFN